MKCEAANELIYLYDVLSPEEREHLENHLLECPSCRALLEEVLHGRQLIQRAATIVHPVPNQAGLTHRVMEAIGQPRTPFFDFQTVGLWLDTTFSRFAMTTASLLLVAFFFFELVSSSATEKISPPLSSEIGGSSLPAGLASPKRFAKASMPTYGNWAASKKRITLTQMATTLPLSTDQFEFANKYLANEKENQMQASYHNLYRCLAQCRERGAMNCTSCKAIFTKLQKRI